MESATTNYATAPLAATVPMHAVAALLGINNRQFSKEVRAGHIAGALPTGNAGYVIGWRTVARLLEERVHQEELESAHAQLLALRSGAMRALDGGFVSVAGARMNAADAFSDDELRQLVLAATSSDEATTPAEFDRWASESGQAVRHRDVMVRLSAGSWRAVLEGVGTARSRRADDPNDPLVAMRTAAKHLAGLALTPARFDEWARAAGCPVRSGQLRKLYGGWNLAKSNAGVELDTHSRRKDGSRN